MVSNIRDKECMMVEKLTNEEVIAKWLQDVKCYNCGQLSTVKVDDIKTKLRFRYEDILLSWKCQVCDVYNNFTNSGEYPPRLILKYVRYRLTTQIETDRIIKVHLVDGKDVTINIDNCKRIIKHNNCLLGEGGPYFFIEYNGIRYECRECRGFIWDNIKVPIQHEGYMYCQDTYCRNTCCCDICVLL